MRIRRGLLFWGLFLIPLGGLPLLTRAGALDAAVFADAWRFWPLVLVALGLSLLLGRHRAGIVGLMAVALVLGSLAGGALASGRVWFGSIGDCAGTGPDTQALDESGTISGVAMVSIDLDCGSADLATTALSGWTVHADYRGRPPTIDASGTSLALRSPDRSAPRHHAWTIAVPAAQLGAVDLRANAGSASLDLAGANLTRLEADANAADLLIDAGSASVGRLSVSVNAGRVGGRCAVARDDLRLDATPGGQ